MRSSIGFVCKMGAIASLLLTFLLIDALLMGTISIVTALCLVPACAWLTMLLVQKSLRPLRRKRAAHPSAYRRATRAIKQPIPFVPPINTPGRAA